MHSGIKIPIYRIKMMKHLLLLLFAISPLYAAEQPSVCQILFSEKEQKSMGFDRQRRMYPPDRGRKLSMMAVKNRDRISATKETSRGDGGIQPGMEICP